MLTKKLTAIIDRVNIDLINGSANKKSDIERSNGWCLTTVATARMSYRYIKDGGTWNHQFFKLKVPIIRLMPYVTAGINGLIARSGNCQECVGLCIYYLFQLPEVQRIDVCSLPECFDHELLRIHSSAGTFLFDAWYGKWFNSETFEAMRDVMNQCIDALSEDKCSDLSREDLDEIDKQLLACQHVVQRGELQLHTDISFSNTDKRIFLHQFEYNYREQLKECYPSSEVSHHYSMT